MFSIFRSDAAQAPLRAVFEQAGDELREAICRANWQVDQQLQQAPHEQGESRDDEVRILLHAPVGVLFEVDADRRLVHILRSWAFRRA